MTGLLVHAPTENELGRLYFELALIGAPAVGRKRAWPYRPRDREQLLLLASEMLRYDPRLLSILLQFLLQYWRTLNPVTLREWMRSMRWPQALLVVLEFAKTASRDREMRFWIDHVAAGWPRVDPSERFFFDAERPASRVATRRVGRNFEAYARWGFLGSEKPIADAMTRRTVGRYDAPTRQAVLSELASRSSGFILADYLEAVDHSISRQQALFDLKRHPGLALRGHGRGARWRRRAR